MKEGKEQKKDNNCLSFFSLINHSTIFIPKSKVRTWQDLLIELERQTGVQANRIDIAVNNQRVYYEPKTKLADIGFRKTDRCFVLIKQVHLNQKDQQNEDRKIQKTKQKCMQSLKIKYQHEQIVRMISLIESNQEYQELFDELSNEYGKVETLIAIQQCQGNRKEALAFLKTQKAGQLAENIYREEERDYLKSFMANQNIKEIKQLIRKEKLSEEAYRGIVRKLFEKYPKFKQYEPRHQKFVQQQLYGKVIDSDSEQGQELQGDSYTSIVAKILSKVQASKQPQRLSNDQRQTFIKKMRTQADDRTIEAALAQANNQLAKAEEIIKRGLIPQLQHFINVCYRTCRINIVLQFFNRPEFGKIKASLRNNSKKAQKFVEWVISENKENSLLASLIKKYKDYAVTLLSGQFCIQKPQKLDNYSRYVKHKPQLQVAKQVRLKEQVEKVCDHQLVAALIKAKIEPKLANYAVRAAKNQPLHLQKYLQLGTDFQQIDFCPEGESVQQLYIYKRLKNEREMIVRLRDKNECLLWLSQLSVLRPKFFEIIVRNKPFVDWMINYMEI